MKISHTPIQGAKFPPSTRVPFRTPQGHFRTVRIKVRKFRTPQFKVQNLFQGAKFSFQGANSPNISFAHPCPRCENFRTVRNSLLAHECHFVHLKPLFARCETRCETRCEIQFKVRISQFKVRNFRTMQSKVRNFQSMVRKFRTVKF